MAADLSTWLNRLASQFIERYLDELVTTWTAFADSLSEIWSWSWRDWFLFIPPAWVGVGLVPRLIETVEAYREFQQDLMLIPARVGSDIVDDVIPVPDSWKSRVFTADQALRFFVREALTFAVDIVDADQPPEVDIVKMVSKYVKLEDFLRDWDADEALKGAKKSAIALTIQAIIVLLKYAGAMLIVVCAGWIVWRVHDDDRSRVVLAERALPQKSPRVYGTRTGQFRPPR